LQIAMLKGQPELWLGRVDELTHLQV
jgi:hypothetical protein